MDLLQATKEGKRIFKITFPDGTGVPFHLLTWQECKSYMEAGQKGNIPADVLENDVFTRCVIDPVIIQQIPDLEAGIVSTVVGVILALSGPDDIETFNNSMDLARQSVDSLDSQIVMIICRAFPAYTPEDVESMTWDRVIKTLAQAERMLMSAGVLEQPIRGLTLEEAKKLNKTSGSGATKRVDLDELMKDAKEMKAIDRTPPPQRPEMAPDAQVLNPRQTEQLRLKQKVAQRVMEARRQNNRSRR